MTSETLRDTRALVEELATESGRYYLVCGRTGERPVPAAGLWFEDRASARAAAGATEQYRRLLRRYDPDLPRCDVIVCERPVTRARRERETDGQRPGTPGTLLDVSGGES